MQLLNSTQTEELVFAGLFLFLAIFVPWIAQIVVASTFRKVLQKLDSDLVESAIKAVKGPLAIYIFVTFIGISLRQFEKLPKGLVDWIGHAETVLIGIALLVFSFRVVDIFAILFKRKMVEGGNTELDERWVKIVGWGGKTVVLFFGIMMIMKGLGKDIIPLITGAGVFGAAFALAAQSTCGNIIGSFEIMMDRLFKEGDRVTFGEYDGFITKMGLRSIQIMALSGETITLPNKDLVDKQIRNLSRGPLVFGKLTVGIEYRHTKADIEKAMEILKEVALAHPKIKECNTAFRSLAASSLDIDLFFWANYKMGAEYIKIISELNMEIKDRFQAAGLSFAFPSSTVYLKKEES